MIDIVIPTLDREQGEDTGSMALLHAGCDANVIVVNGSARGFTKTVNEGMRQATGDVCVLNDDVTWFQYGWLDTLHRALYSEKQYGIAGPSGRSKSAANGGKLGETGIEEVGRLSFWCVLLKRAMIDDIGILDERYIHYCSDNEYCIRAGREGWQTIWVRDVFLEHDYHGSGLRSEWKRHDMREFKKAGLS